MIKYLIAFLTFTMISGCAYLNTVSQTSIPKDRGNKISVVGSNYIFLLLNFNNDFVDEAVTELKGKCPNGSIKGIFTKDEKIVYFPLLVHRDKVYIEGYCQKEGNR